MPRCFCQIYTHNNLTLSPVGPNLEKDDSVQYSYSRNHISNVGKAVAGQDDWRLLFLFRQDGDNPWMYWT